MCLENKIVVFHYVLRGRNQQQNTPFFLGGFDKIGSETGDVSPFAVKPTKRTYFTLLAYHMMLR